MSESYEDIEMVNGLNLRRTSDLNTSGSIVSTNRASWDSRTDSRPPMATRISMSDQRIAQEGLANNPAWDPNPFSAAGDLFHFAKSSRIEQENRMGRGDSTRAGNYKTSFPIPYAEPIGIPEVGMDPVLQGMTSTDDLFFDLLNLEQLSVTNYYHSKTQTDILQIWRPRRDLSKSWFSFPTDTQGQFPSPSYDGQSLATHPSVANTADDWSPLFRQPSGSGPSRGNT
jgi:hypothetical protein